MEAEAKEIRRPSSLAPSLPQLSDREEAEIDRIIDRFILADTGRLRGLLAKKAVLDFQKLGPCAIFGLIRGMNKAAVIEASCPALSIGKKLATMLRSTTDVELLEFARENIGVGLDRSTHRAVLADLRVLCMSRLRPVKKAVGVMKKRLKHEESDVRLKATKKLASLGMPLRKELIELLLDSNAKVRKGALRAVVR
jgi:hypothetical protein